MAWQDLLRHNRWLKLSALALAVLSWFIIHLAIQYDLHLEPYRLGNANIREFRRLRITTLSDPTSPRRFQIIPGEVSVRVQGSSRLLSELSEKDIQVFVNLTDIKDAFNLLRKVEVLCPTGIQPVRIRPEVVRIELVDNP